LHGGFFTSIELFASELGIGDAFCHEIGTIRERSIQVPWAKMREEADEKKTSNARQQGTLD
jgi:hypothetical protein